MQLERDGAWEIVGAATVVLIVLAITVNATVGWSETGAAWVQAIGSVLALFVTGGLVVWEVRSRRLEAARIAADRLSARIAVIELATNRFESYAKYQKNLVSGALDPKQRGEHLRIKYALNEAKLVELSEMPNKLCVEALAFARAVVDLMSVCVEETGENPVRLEDLATLEVIQTELKSCVAVLRAEARRLAS